MNTSTKITSFIINLAIISAVFLTIFGAAQQVIRQGANDPQLQIAGDMTDLLSGGARLADVEQQVGALRKVDLAQSLSPFVAIYDASGKLLASSGAIDGQPIALPDGVLRSADKTGRNLVTLQPPSGVRVASAVRTFDQTIYGQGKGYVVSGKSLSEAESRIHKIGLMILVAWLFSIIAFIIKSAIKFRASSK